MNTKVQKILDDYHQRIVDEGQIMQSLPIEEGMARRDEFLLPVGKEVGSFLNNMIKSAKLKVILEVGTSYGYSTVWMAEAASQINGKVITLEIDPDKVTYAKEQLQTAGLDQYVDFRIGDAVQLIEDASEAFDFVLIDIWKELYVPAFEAVFPKLNKGSYVIGDNMIFPPHHHKEAAAYKAAVKSKGVFESVLLPIGSGIEVSHYL